jgi:hypothetical protein
MRKLVFVHGRAQQHKDASALKEFWIHWLNKGFENAELQRRITNADVRFPFYGDTLDVLAGDEPENAPDVIIRGAAGSSDLERAFTENVVMEAAKAWGFSKAQIFENYGEEVNEKGFANLPWVLAILRTLDRSGGSSSAISLATHDVYQYLRNPGVRDKIETGVEESITAQEETVIVSHSLGTVVAYCLLRRVAKSRGWTIPRLVTLGSPLAVSAIRQALAPVAFPACVGDWYNARDKNDVVPLYPLVPRFFPGPPVVDNNSVDNRTSNHHGIEGYLSDRDVAKAIDEAL